MNQEIHLRTWRRRNILFYALALAVMIAPVAYLWVTNVPEKSATAAAVNDGAPQSEPAPIARAVSMTRQLKLSTVVVETVVRTRAADERWNGTAAATIEARARHSFGVDLS